MIRKADIQTERQGIVFLLTFALLLFFTVSAYSFETKIVKLHFRDSAMVNDTLIRVSDVAVVSSADAQLNEKLRAAVAGNSAPAGYSRLLNAEDLVMYRLRSQYKEVKFEITGNGRVQVSTDFVEKRVGDYLNEINAYLQSVVLWPKGNWEAKVENPEVSWKCLNAPLSVKVDKLENGYPKGRRQLVLIAEQGRKEYRINVICKFKVKIPVLVSSKLIQRGHHVSTQDCEVKVIDITHFAPVPFTSFDHVNGMRAARTISQGTILHDRLLKAIPVVDKGDRVQILLEKGRVKVAVAAVAREPGGIGDQIWVENTVSKKLIRVMVKGKGTVIASQGGSSI